MQNPQMSDRVRAQIFKICQYRPLLFDLCFFIFRHRAYEQIYQFMIDKGLVGATLEEFMHSRAKWNKGQFLAYCLKEIDKRNESRDIKLGTDFKRLPRN